MPGTNVSGTVWVLVRPQPLWGPGTATQRSTSAVLTFLLGRNCNITGIVMLRTCRTPPYAAHFSRRPAGYHRKLRVGDAVIDTDDTDTVSLFSQHFVPLKSQEGDKKQLISYRKLFADR